MSMQQSQPNPIRQTNAAALPWWRRLIQAPSSLTNIADQRQAQLLLGLSLIFLLTAIFGAIFSEARYIQLVLAAASAIAVGFSRTRHYRIGSAIFITALIALAFTRLVSGSATSLFLIPLIFLLAALLLPYRWAVAAILGNVLGLILLPIAFPETYTEFVGTIGVTSVLGFLFIFSTAFRNNLERARVQELQDTNQALEGLRSNLDRQIQARTAELALAVEAGNQFIQVQDTDVLLEESGPLIRDFFDLYSAHVYQANQNRLEFRPTFEEVEELALQSRSLPIDMSSIYGQAALQQTPVVVENVAEDSAFQPNPLLPETRSEMAFPLLISSELLGVLHLQDNKIGTLTEDSLPTFQTVANQLAVALNNALLFSELAEANREVERIAQRLTREAWDDYLDGINQPEQLGAQYVQNEIRPLATSILGTTPDAGTAHVPVTIANEPIGVIAIEHNEAQPWTPETKAMVTAVSQQVSQQIEHLRLLNEADRYRADAENTAKRMLREAWETYGKEIKTSGFEYAQGQVQPVTQSEEIEADISVPLDIQGEVIGQLFLEGMSTDDENAAYLVETIASQLSEHIDKLRLRQQTESTLAQTERLYQVGHDLNAANNVQEVLEAAISPMKAKGIRESTLMFIELNNQGKPQALELLADWRPEGNPSFPVGTRFALEDFPFTKLFIDNPGVPQFVANAAVDETLDTFTKNVMLQVGIQAMVVVPLTLSGQWVGIMTCSWAAPHQFSNQEKAFFDSLINLAAPAVQSHRLFANTKSQADKERMINAINQQIQLAPTVESALQTAVSELGKALQTQYTQVKLTTTTESDQPKNLIKANGNGTV